MQDVPCRIVEVNMQDLPTKIIDELELWEPVEMPDTPTRLADGLIIEGFMLEEEEIDF